jgi:2-phosphosulfolactate phosphatase
MRVHVAFTPSEAATAELGIVVDVLRATSTIAQALAAGYRRVLCCAEVEQARALRASVTDAIVGGERDAVPIEGFDVGASPREFLEPLAETLVLSTTNGTRAILAAAERCGQVVLGSLLNLDAVAAAARAGGGGGDVAILCAGFKGTFAFDDAYCAGRIVEALGDGGERTDAAIAAELLARAYPRPLDGLNARTYGPPGLEADIEWCARESVLDVVPRLACVVDGAAEITA